MEEFSATRSYENLKNYLGKEFVDSSLVEILWFKETIDVIEDDWSLARLDHSVAYEARLLLGNLDVTLALAREKIQTEVDQRYMKYFQSQLWDMPWPEDIHKCFINLIDDSLERLETETVMDSFFDFMSFANHPWDIAFEYPEYGDRYGRVDRSSIVDRRTINTKYASYLQHVYVKLSEASEQEKNAIFFVSEMYRLQSGTSKGIWNWLNYMYQIRTMDEVFWPTTPDGVAWFIAKLWFLLKKQNSSTPEYARVQIWEMFEKIYTTFVYPEERYRKRW